MRTQFTLGLRSLTALALVACGSNGGDATPTGAGGSTSATGAGGGTLIATGGYSSDEVCGDGLDNDGNGLADDGCDCDIGATQQCFVGPPSAAGKGECSYGEQECVRQGSGEIVQGRWASCEDAGAASDETCKNGLDDDCDGEVDEGCDLSTLPSGGLGATTGNGSASNGTASNGTASNGTASNGTASNGTASNGSESGAGGKQPPIVEAGSTASLGVGGTMSTTGSTTGVGAKDETSSTASLGVGGTMTSTTSSSSMTATNSTTSTTSTTSSSTSTSTGTGGCSPGTKVTLVVDRSNSMARKPNGDDINSASNYGASRWALAVDAIHTMVNKGDNLGLDFGLELFPRYFKPGNGKGCQTLKDRITNGPYTTNDPNVCTVAQTPVAPSSTSNAKILSDVTVLGTLLCDETPIEIALDRLLTVNTQNVVLITDGGPTCGQTPANAAKKLAAQGKHTFVVGYDGAVLPDNARKHLNNTACAGGEPKNAAACNGDKFVGPADAFFLAKSGADLTKILNDILGLVCK